MGRVSLTYGQIWSELDPLSANELDPLLAYELLTLSPPNVFISAISNCLL